MSHARRTGFLRSGIIFTVTGALVLAVMGMHHRLPLWGSVALGVSLVVIGLPMLVMGLRARSGNGNTSDSS